MPLSGIFYLTNNEIKIRLLPQLLISDATMKVNFTPVPTLTVPGLDMLSAVKEVLNFFLRSKDEPDQYKISYSTEDENSEYIRRIGFITFVSDDYGLIDDNLLFYQRVAHQGKTLAVGDRVSYLFYREKGKNGSGKVISVVEYADLNTLSKLLGENFLELRSIDRVSLNYAKALITKNTERVVNGKVSRKIGKRIFIFPLSIHCDLDKVQIDFIPIEGDWVSVKTELVNDPFGAGQRLRVTKLEPVLIKHGTGAITSLKDNNDEGVIENEIVFTKDVAAPDFKPTLAYPVKYSAIESIQGSYKWRALSIQGLSNRGKDKDQEKKKKTATRFKNGIVIRGKFEFGPMNLDDTEEIELEIKNNGKANRTLSHCNFTSAYCSSQVQLKEPKDPVNLVLLPGQQKKFVFICKSRFLGISKEVFEFYFKGFKMDYLFIVNVTLTNEMKALLPEENSQTSHPKKNTYLYQSFDYSDAFFGLKLSQRSRYAAPNTLSKSCNYTVPEKLFKIILGDPAVCKTKKHSHILQSVLKHYPSLGKELNIDIYKERFHTLLHFEEIEDRIMYRKYDLHGVILRKKDNFLVLDVPRVIEDKIILGIGTQVIVTQPWSANNTGKQVGYIHEYREQEIIINFHESFERSYDGSECDVMFQPSRTTYIRSHVAVDTAVANLGSAWLFPSELVEAPPVLKFQDESDEGDSQVGTPLDQRGSLNMNGIDSYVDDADFVLKPMAKKSKRSQDNNMGLEWFNKDLNLHQKRAVKNILEGKGRAVPYIIQGPPGTGKTVTIIELVLQLYNLMSDSRIIIATPSNSAADLVCQKIIETGNFSPGQVVRVLSFGRLLSGNFPEEIGPFCTSSQEDMQMVQARGFPRGRFLNMTECLGSERIVIGTCCALSILHDYGLKPGHFTHIIIDEAAQSTEPETLIPMNFLNAQRGQVILTGDTEQLGPISINFLSVQFGFSKSYMERITQTGPYLRSYDKYPKTDGFDPRCVTRLKYNYRSVPEILRLPNLMFYDSELIPTLPDNHGKMAQIIEKLNDHIGNPHKNACMVFHGLCSENVQEVNNFSWYNPHELWQTVCYLKKLYDLDLTPNDIGVITPYQKQVEKLRYILSGLKVPMPKIGSVEEFQGQERMVIILSTVRSSVRQAGSKESVIGFLSCPRRLNVAITRAKSLLIIIGNPFTLSVDPYWSEVIKYCVRHCYYVGCPIDELFNMPSP